MNGERNKIQIIGVPDGVKTVICASGDTRPFDAPGEVVLIADYCANGCQVGTCNAFILVTMPDRRAKVVNPLKSGEMRESH